jgi:hypothetical protein
MGLFDFLGGGNSASSKVSGKYGKLFGDAYGDYKTLHGLFGNSNLMEQLGTALNSFNQPNEQKVQKAQNGANDRAAQQANSTAQFLKTQGFGDGLTGGATANAFQQATNQTNQYAQDLEDPEHQLRQFLAMLQGAGGLQSLYMNPLQQFGQSVYAAPQDQNPFASILGGFAGNYASALGKKAGQ